MLEVWNTFVIKQSMIANGNLNEKNNYVSALMKIKKDLRFNNEYSDAALQLYKDELIGDYFSKVESIKWFKYRYSLLVDALYIFAFENKKKGKRVLNYIANQMDDRYHPKLIELFDVLYNNKANRFEKISPQVNNWKINYSFNRKPLKTIAFVANMSAGKSTLINALVGKEINSSKTSSCTQKRHYIYSKPYEDGFICENDFDIDFNADKNLLMEDNTNNKSDIIRVGTAFHSEETEGERFCFIDTPGVNAEDKRLREKSYNLIKRSDYDALVFIFNAQYVATTSDGEYLKFIKENTDTKKLIIVVNKFDAIDDDDIECNYKNSISEYLKSFGFDEAPIVYLSSRTAFLAKNAESLTEKGKREYNRLLMNVKDLREHFTENSSDIAAASGIKQLEKILKECNCND